ncbi:MAG TPA: site-specific DNA-methyltransferase [Microbacteriaceae bacterium]|nr:site-specific DNA-methyltransferase [Microbacteriaceae bacterium]
MSRELDPGSVQTIVTSPPYFGLRDYGVDGQLGAEQSVQEYVDRMVALFRSLRDVLADDGTLWLNLGDSYSGAGPSGASYDSATTRRRAEGDGMDGKFRVSKRLAERDLDYSRKKPVPTSGIPAKNLIGVPWRVAFALQDDGWILRSDIIWAKPNPMPESVADRPTKAHEYLFLMSKSPRYYYDAEAIKEPAITGFNGSEFHTGKTGEHQLERASKQPRFGGNKYGLGNDTPKSGNEYAPNGRANKRTVWSVPTVPFSEAHFAVYPPELIRPCILAGSRRGDTVLDPFSGSGTTGMVATQEGRRYIGVDLNREYLELSLRSRFAQPVLDMTGGDVA